MFFRERINVYSKNDMKNIQIDEKNLRNLEVYSMQSSKEVPINKCLKTSDYWAWVWLLDYWNMSNFRVITTEDALSGCHACQNNLQLFFSKEVRSFSKISVFTRMFQQAFSTHCSNTSQSLISSEHVKAAICLYRKKKSETLRSGDRAGQLTGPPRLIHCQLKVWYRCCLTRQGYMHGTHTKHLL
jgi:hypothetical protein